MQNQFQQAILNEMVERAKTDEQLAAGMARTDKNIENCCQYILTEVKKTGREGFADDEIFGMAVHYYTEDNLKIRSNIKAKVVVNKSITLDEDEIRNAKQKAIDEVIAAEKSRITKKKVANTDNDNIVQTSLF